MRTLWTLLCLLAAIGSASAANPQRKSLIEFGWDEPDTSFLREHLDQLERTPFDGCVFHVDAKNPDSKPASLTWQAWGHRAFTEPEVAHARRDLKAIGNGRFSRNFLRFNVTPADLDWFDNFDAILSNSRVVASLAREGRCAGVLLDTEQYQGEPFRYSKCRDAKIRSWEVYAAQARRRGREVMEAFQSEFPDLVVMLTFGHSMAWRGSDGGKKPLADGEYGLLAPFVDGMIEAAKGKSRIVDGYELSYGYKTDAQFADAAKLMREGVLPIVAEPAGYARVVTPGFGLWMDFDWRAKGWNVEDTSKNYFTPESFEASVRAALAHSDEFVWIYTESPRWWSPQGKSVKLPASYDEALRRARREITPRKPG